MKRIAAVALVLLVMVACLPALGETDRPLNLPWIDSGGTDPFQSPWFDRSSMYTSLVFDFLFMYDQQGLLTVPSLAESYSVSEDRLTYEFVIRSGVKWHDGATFFVDDVIFTLKAYLLCQEAAYKSFVLYIEGAEAFMNGEAEDVSGMTASGSTLTLKTTMADALFIQRISEIVILPKHLLEDVDPMNIHKDEGYGSFPTSTGMYKVSETSFPSYFKLEAYEDYFKGAPKIKNITFTSYVTGGQDA